MSDEPIGKYPAGIDPAMIHLTGTIVTWWGRVEGLMIRDLISLRNCFPEFAAKEPFPVQSGNVVKQWKQLQRKFWADDEKRLARLEKLGGEISEAAEDRNVLVHYFWPYAGPEARDELKLQSIKPRRGDNSTLEFKEVTITVAKLNDVNERLVRLYHSVMVDSLNLVLQVNRRLGPPIVGKGSK